MHRLIHGLHHFQDHIFTEKQSLFENLSENQTPRALFITCSDSRINPNLITQTEPGEIFILRNAGNIIPPYGASNGGEGATIEYAVKALGVKDIIICGHSDCGAIKGLMDKESLASMPSVEQWLSHAEATRCVVHDNYSHLDDEERVNVAIQENVLIQMENLRTLPAVASRLVKGDLYLHCWVYKIKTGEVFSYDPDKGQFVHLLEAPQPGTQNSRLTTLPSI